ncbi:Soluble lytic murein transglycosylase [Halioglobus japonicus]|nr:Soluble lytic murein transglycosylase [Halioglobus japonicus]
MKFLLRSGVAAVMLSAVAAGADTNSTVLSAQGTVLSNATSAQESDAEQPAMKIFKYTNRSGVRSYSDRAPMGVSYEIVQLSCFACNVKSTLDWNNIPLYLNDYRSTITAAARKYQVDPALVRAVIHAESAFRPGARSKKGALGLMQLMPATARDMDVVDALEPQDNIFGGVRYLAWLLEQNGGNTMLATAAYNAGPGAVKRHNGIPPYEETRTYVKRVKLLHDRYKLALNKTFSGEWISQADSY